MLSILIPVLNYGISQLVTELHHQATNAEIDFEIICFNDASNAYIMENRGTVEKLTYTKIIDTHVNVGRTQARQHLCNQATFDWLLFLDADVLPKSKAFIALYLNNISSGYDAFFGGFAYADEPPNKNNMLRWKYGIKFEEVDASKRNKKPYQLIISANFLIKKEVFNAVNSKIKRKSYGLDNYFAALLKQNNIKVLHLNNEVYHLGLENNQTYLQKTEEAVTTLLWVIKHTNMPKQTQKLLYVFDLLKKVKLNILMAFLYKHFSTTIKKNLLSTSPNIHVLQLYKLLYICYKDKRTTL